MVDDPGRLASAVAATLTGALILSVYGFWPGSTQIPLTMFRGAGSIECLHDQGWASLGTWCESVGLPVGKPLLMGLPQIYLGWGLRSLPGIDAWDAHNITSAALTLIGYAGGIYCVVRWTGRRWLGVTISALYLLSPSLVHLNGFEYTFHGFVLLPAYIAASLLILDAFDRGAKLAPLIGFVALAQFMAFTEGYSFLAGALAIAAIVALRTIGSTSPLVSIRAILPVGAFLVSFAAAALAYTWYVPGNSYEHHLTGVTVFRYLGLDLAALVLPTDYIFSFRLAGIDPSWPLLWGAGSNYGYNYLGLSVIGLVLWLVVRGRRGLSNPTRLEVGGLLLGGALALVLALGPDLKVYDVAYEVTPAWDMPADAASLNLPTAWIYTSIPGVSEMRATYRWFLVTRFAAVAASGVAIGLIATKLGRRATDDGRWYAAFVAPLVLLVVGAETLVDLDRQYDSRQRSVERVELVRDEIIPEADRLLESDDVLLVLPSSNDFLADVVVPMIGASSFNVGGDKNYRFARDSWPDSVEAAVVAYRTDGAADAICRALDDSVDAVVLSHIDFRTGALLHGDRSAEDAALRERAALIAADERFDVATGEWLTVVRPSGASCTEPSP